MATLQVKGLPDDLHAQLRRRAADEGLTLSTWVTRVLRREVALPSVQQWAERVRQRPLLDEDVDTASALDEVRAELD